MPSRERCEELRAAAFADDLEITDQMLAWSEDQVERFFESGGEEVPEKQPTEVGSRGSTEVDAVSVALSALGLEGGIVRSLVLAREGILKKHEQKDSRGVLDLLKTAGVAQLGLRQKCASRPFFSRAAFARSPSHACTPVCRARRVLNVMRGTEEPAIRSDVTTRVPASTASTASAAAAPPVAALPPVAAAPAAPSAVAPVRAPRSAAPASEAALPAPAPALAPAPSLVGRLAPGPSLTAAPPTAEAPSPAPMPASAAEICGPDGCLRPIVPPASAKAIATVTAAPAAPAAPPPDPVPPTAAATKSVLRVRCGEIELKLTLNAKLLGRSFGVAVIKPFLDALNKRAAAAITLADLQGVRVDDRTHAPGEVADAIARDVLRGAATSRVEIVVPSPPEVPLPALPDLGDVLTSLPTLPPPPPPLATPILTASQLRSATRGELGARLRLMPVSELQALFPRHLLATPLGATTKDDLVAALVEAPRAEVHIEVVSDVV